MDFDHPLFEDLHGGDRPLLHHNSVVTGVAINIKTHAPIGGDLLRLFEGRPMSMILSGVTFAASFAPGSASLTRSMPEVTIPTTDWLGVDVRSAL